MPYCTQCGAPVKDKDKFCPICGAPTAKITREEFTVSGSNLVDRVRDLLHEGNVTRVIVKDEKGKTLRKIPERLASLAVMARSLGIIAALATKCEIVVERRE